MIFSFSLCASFVEATRTFWRINTNPSKQVSGVYVSVEIITTTKRFLEGTTVQSDWDFLSCRTHGPYCYLGPIKSLFPRPPNKSQTVSNLSLDIGSVNWKRSEPKSGHFVWAVTTTECPDVVPTFLGRYLCRVSETLDHHETSTYHLNKQVNLLIFTLY